MPVAPGRITTAVVLGLCLAATVGIACAHAQESDGGGRAAAGDGDGLAPAPLVPGGAATVRGTPRVGRAAGLRGASGRYVDASPLPPLGRGAGVRLGSRWVFLPSVSASVAYDDNVDAAPSGEREGDVVGTASLQGRLQSTLARHSFGVGGVLSRSLFADDTRPSEFNWSIGADARLDLDRRSALDADLSYTRDQVDTTDPDQADLVRAGAVDPDEARLEDRFDSLSLGLGYTRRAAEWSGRIDTSLDRVAFAETDDGDRLEVGVGGSLRRGIGRQLGVSVTPSYRRAFFADPSPGEVDRDFQRFSLGAGADYSWPFGLRLGVTISPVYTDFIDPGRDDDFNIDVDFDVGVGEARGIPLTRQTTLTVEAGRNTGVSTAEDFSTRTSTFAGAGIDHVIGPSLSAGGGVGVSRDSFDNGDRVDHSIDADARLSYAIRSGATATLSYAFTKRFADDADDDFYRNTVRLGVTLAF
jgi:hypothetical protein